MLIIKHRINSIDKLKNTNFNFGVEFDVRSHNKKIIVNHEPFKKSIFLNHYLKFFKHKFAIVNIKEEGIEKSVIKILKKNKIKKYFLLDVTIPQIYKLSRIKFNNFALRLSKFENLKKINQLNSKINWIWIDTFDAALPLKIRDIKLLKKKYKICLVSPELTGSNFKKVRKLISKVKKSKINIDAVCTKRAELWN